MRNNWKKHQLFDLYDVRSGMGNKSRKDFHPTKYENKMIMFKDVFIIQNYLINWKQLLI